MACPFIQPPSGSKPHSIMPYLCNAVAAAICTIIPNRTLMSEQDFLELPI
jgi:hypothetical protein